MSPEEKNETIKGLVKEAKCTENQARNALELSRYNVEIAKSIVKEYTSAKKTNYVGGVSGQIQEVPKSQYADEFARLMQHSNQNQGETAKEKRLLTIYRNGFLIDDQFTRLSPKERDSLMKRISETGEVPSDMFRIHKGDLVDVEIDMKLDEMYKEAFPGESYSIKQSLPKETGSTIDLGTQEVTFKLTVNKQNVIVKMGGSSSFLPLKSYLDEKNIKGSLFHEEKCVSWDEDPSKYSRTRLSLHQ
ncbi:hypothetical protein NEFER03_0527 [Nematocida sp. LUAm3]|nr:hypothetical protein NEFER03_0527 [Nematocida sp. LUAm3]KAI5175494.1 hypothetical protein NEFER02_1400 [Nematocida sp. LUAm2]KAI5178476.1 hypothetical protein NEFER01_1623 [Nematocida sp. LUAm1]